MIRRLILYGGLSLLAAWCLGFVYFAHYINSYEIENITISQIEKQAKIKADDESKIELGRKAKNTIENAIEAEEWIKKNNIKSIRLVTSSYHIPRSLQEFIIYVTKENDLEVILNPIYSPNVNIKWWKSWGTFRLLVMEYNKFLVVYICRHLHIY